MEFSLDISAILQAITIAAMLGAARWLHGTLGRIEEKVGGLSESQAVSATKIEAVQREQSRHDRRIGEIERVI